MSSEEKSPRIAFIFPGQGAQYVGMGHDFCGAFSVARETFEEANHILGESFSQLIFEGPEEKLTETRNSQLGIYITSIALMRVLQSQLPKLRPSVCAGLSLGEYSAVTASGRISFADCLPLVRARGTYMNDACESTEGGMAVVTGLDAAEVEFLVEELSLPEDLWAANYNCPGQIVVSGTQKGIDAFTEAAKKQGAKRVLPLNVHGAFHSGLMQSAESRLAPHVIEASFVDSDIDLVMNVPGTYVKDLAQIRNHLIKQVTSPVRWEQGIRKMDPEVDLFIGFGPCKSLLGMNRKIGVKGRTLTLDKITDLDQLLEAVCAS
ncbi:MAG: [acyl-carrier-protein] S-malonyltransferase [Waddliaceae bacterium]|nr:[acyl-carrier-protein] S-malonyltransferase [Waddliaceae bacterium]